MKIISTAVFLFFCIFAHAENLSAKGQSDFYSTCFPSCKESQLKNPDNLYLLDKPFIFEAYCSCYCTKMALRISVKQANDLIRSKIDGKSPPKEISDLISTLSQVCMKPLFDK